MASGIHSTIHALNTRLIHRWVPKWYGAFSDPRGGFYERLGKGFKPVLTGQRRLVTQCRQLSIYSHAQAAGSGRFPQLGAQFDFILSHYHDPQTGLWHFALEDSFAVADRTCDLYALSFVIFACSHYHRATGDDRARDAAHQVLQLIDRQFRFEDQPGFAEALDSRGRPVPKIRRQNPHMHLFEACVFAYDAWRNEAYKLMADELLDLFRRYFFDAQTAALPEFYSDALHPHFEQGGRLEPGHYFEWVWLIKKYGALIGQPDLEGNICAQLLDWANRYGWDDRFGGIYDVVAIDGTVIADTKRIWPFCEALKANSLMLNEAGDRQAAKDRVTDMVRVFSEKYMQERGFWTEWLTRDLMPVTDYMPGTTPYHVYFGIVETLATLDGRGANKSLAATTGTVLYRIRRFLSAVARRLRGLFRR